MYALRNATTAIMRNCAALSSPSISPNFQAAGSAAVLSFRKLSSVFSAHADPIASELSSFGETTVETLLASKGDDDSWLWCTANDNVYTAIHKMSRANVGSLIVLDSGNTNNAAAIRGIFTERDYMKKIVLTGKNSSETSIYEIMTPKAAMMTIGPKNSVMEAMDLMVENQSATSLCSMVIGSWGWSPSATWSVMEAMDQNEEADMADQNLNGVAMATSVSPVDIARHHFHGFLVLDGDRILGMVSIRDVVHIMVEEHKKSMEMMSSYINGTY
eukprot:CAMPEP_0117664624 /NCGR_PEP_ID=MMETSP0804-20121206/9330_1 /TAXON_ID=1074897 /ORGANISM="Tetraselmis astigmatica, Strain CCMP880" /LENGTH=272 /DNA_ID=CAMNT_0005471891 /DNA_START=370 /DNA_END=1189 /DNA_ORIENTATION=-